MEEKQLLLRIENLEKRVSLLEKQLETISQINQSEKVKEYIASAEKASKIAKLLDAATDKKTNDSQIENESISDILSSGSMMEKIDTAKDFVSDIDSNVEMQIRDNNDKANKYDWDTLFDYEEVDGQITIKSYIGFDDLEGVVIPDRINGLLVTKIGEKAFENCRSIKEVVLPQFLITIEDEAFWGSSIKTISLQKSLIHIGKNAFAFSKLEKINIPSKVAKISDSAFYCCSTLKVISLSEGITSIDEKAFYSCEKLSKIDIPSSVKHIGSFAFYECGKNNVERGVHIRIPDSVILFDEYASSGIKMVFCNSGSTAMKYARKYSIPVKRYEEFDLLRSDVI